MAFSCLSWNYSLLVFHNGVFSQYISINSSQNCKLGFLFSGVDATFCWKVLVEPPQKYIYWWFSCPKFGCNPKKIRKAKIWRILILLNHHSSSASHRYGWQVQSITTRVMPRIWATYRPTYETQQFSVFMLRHLHKIYNYNQDSQFFYIVWIWYVSLHFYNRDIEFWII